LAKFISSEIGKNPRIEAGQVAAELDELDALAGSAVGADDAITYRLAYLVERLVDRIESEVGPISHSDLLEFLSGLSIVEQAKWILWEIDYVLGDHLASPSQEVKELGSLRKRVQMNKHFLEELQEFAICCGEVKEAEMRDLEKALRMVVERAKRVLNNYL